MLDGCQKVRFSLSLSVFSPAFSGIFVRKFRGSMQAQPLEISYDPMFVKGCAILGHSECLVLGGFVTHFGYFMSP